MIMDVFFIVLLLIAKKGEEFIISFNDANDKRDGPVLLEMLLCARTLLKRMFLVSIIFEHALD